MSVNIHYLCHALLFQCIFAGANTTVSSLLTIIQANCIQAHVNKIVEFNMSFVYYVLQSGLVFMIGSDILLLTLELKVLTQL